MHVMHQAVRKARLRGNKMCALIPTCGWSRVWTPANTENGSGIGACCCIMLVSMPLDAGLCLAT